MTDQADRFLIQMSGAPGAGKSTIAGRLAPLAGGVVIDLDVIKSALIDCGQDFGPAGTTAYQIIWSMTDHLLEQGHSVIVDSPCFHSDVLETGTALAAKHGARYLYIECRTDDLDLLDRRMRARPARPSQRASLAEPPRGAPPDGVDAADLFRDWIAHMVRPKGDYLLIRTDRGIEDCMREVRRYLAGVAAWRQRGARTR